MADGGLAQNPLAPLLAGLPGMGERVSGQQQQAGAEKQQESLSHDGTDPAYITEFEPYEGMSHEDIYNAVQQMQPGVMQHFGDRWVAMFVEMSGAATGLMVQTARAAASLEGAFASAGQAAGRQFSADVADVYTVLSTVGHRVKAAAYGAEAVKAAVPAPAAATTADTSLTPVLILADLAAPGNAAEAGRQKEEARQQAITTMNLTYMPTYGPAGENVPTFVAPTQPGALDTTDPGTGGNGGSNNNNNGGTTGGGTENPTDEGATENPGTTEESTDPGTTDEDDTTAAGTDSGNSNGANNSQGQNGSTTNPASTNPSGTSPASTALGTGGGSRGTGGGGGGSNPGGSTPGQGSPTPGKAAAGQNLAAAGGSGAGGSAAGRASGMPMMGAPGARGGGKGDDDDEHKAPDYLRGVQPELFGDDVLAVPGAIGSDAPSTRLAEQQDGSAEAP
ncbi:hypothetical protein FEK33_04855 [Nocardia asteroides NBRC 15531]|uniref:PPE family domain-containing protein n=1 Tax=Nocardia asteroides NBRC 15531 TaxID=1110697 RepID=U5EB52_NOCAS|nr:hypothetical protein [Nocardia asteroides]TLF69620.1 hypothetical protein FEK33_04855 [Nocardia asteroides NBRC 15531]UGT49120.1 hypothetical protein LT345_00335 [Nocardia asteroides]SFL80991.1 hypothetical protein SAMN05444423_101988 [Nocardia asteroides]VEG31092.1 Uncharacterised protein [Nocardia asteroides]GAD83688.1 hypothetical protein NCAST_20_02570 [Nocardia asteroides NBRC 15531]